MYFTHMRPCKGFRYFLVMVDTFMGWVEAFPTKTESIRGYHYPRGTYRTSVWNATLITIG